MISVTFTGESLRRIQEQIRDIGQAIIAKQNGRKNAVVSKAELVLLEEYAAEILRQQQQQQQQPLLYHVS